MKAQRIHMYGSIIMKILEQTKKVKSSFFIVRFHGKGRANDTYMYWYEHLKHDTKYTNSYKQFRYWGGITGVKRRYLSQMKAQGIWSVTKAQFTPLPQNS